MEEYRDTGTPEGRDAAKVAPEHAQEERGEEVYLDVCKGAGIGISEITHEAAEMMGLPRGPAYQVHVKGAREGSDFRARGVSFICRTAARGSGSGEVPA